MSFKQLTSIGFLVKKPAQFDVPFFRFAACNPNGYRLVVFYIHAPNHNSLEDAELSHASGWDMNLVEGYPWHYLPPPFNEATFTAVLKKEDIRLMITNGYQPPYEQFLNAVKNAGIPLALRIDSVLFGRSFLKNWIRKWVLRRLYAPFGLFLTTGKAGYEFLDFIDTPKPKQGWFPYCTDNRLFSISQPGVRERLGIEAEAYVVLAVCKFNKRENPLELVEAFMNLRDKSMQLIMVGDGEQRQLLESVSRLNSNIHFTGYIPYSELPGYYQAADLFVHPAFYEPWGVSVQEAIAAGCAVVCSDKVGSGFDLVEAGKNGFRYPHGKPALLAEKIRAAFQLDRQVVKQTNQAILETWNYDNVWRQLQLSMQQLPGQG